MIRALLIILSNSLAGLCGVLAAVFQWLERHLDRCPDCGRSRYFGAACVTDSHEDF